MQSLTFFIFICSYFTCVFYFFPMSNSSWQTACFTLHPMWCHKSCVQHMHTLIPLPTLQTLQYYICKLSFSVLLLSSFYSLSVSLCLTLPICVAPVVSCPGFVLRYWKPANSVRALALSFCFQYTINEGIFTSQEAYYADFYKPIENIFYRSHDLHICLCLVKIIKYSSHRNKRPRVLKLPRD